MHLDNVPKGRWCSWELNQGRLRLVSYLGKRRKDRQNQNRYFKILSKECTAGPTSRTFLALRKLTIFWKKSLYICLRKDIKVLPIHRLLLKLWGLTLHIPKKQFWFHQHVRWKLPGDHVPSLKHLWSVKFVFFSLHTFIKYYTNAREKTESGKWKVPKEENTEVLRKLCAFTTLKSQILRHFTLFKVDLRYFC